MNALLYLAVVLIWGTTWIAITLQQEGPVAIPVSIAYRFAIAAAVMFAVLLLTRRLRRLAPRDHITLLPIFPRISLSAPCRMRLFVT